MTTNGDMVVVTYPDAPGDVNSTEYEAIAVWGRFAVVYGEVPMPPAERQQTAYMVVNLVHETVEYYSPSFVQARATMHQLEGLWDNLDEAEASAEAEDFAEEDNEMDDAEQLKPMINSPLRSIN